MVGPTKAPARDLRLAVYCDYSYRRADGGVWAELAFANFLAGLADHFARVTLVGRLDPQPGPWHHALPAEVAFEPLPYYGSLAKPAEPARALLESVRRFWRVLGRVDAVWLLGPHPLAVTFALLAALRGRPVALGVRQDLRLYMRNRHPDARALRFATALLEAVFVLLARRCPVVVVGSAMEHRYRRAPRLLPLRVSLVPEREIAPAKDEARDWDGEWRVLSVGRLDAEKNPVLLADVLARLAREEPRWRLVVCGEGPLRSDLEARLQALDVGERAELLGYVPLDGRLLELYRSSHLLLHCSWTEGVPQVLYEAFAQRLPVVATDVGGVREAAQGAALLVAPGDAEAPARALARLAHDGALRTRLVAAGVERAREHSLEAGTQRVAAFLAETLGRRRRRWST